MHRLYRCFGGFAGSDAPTATPRELRKRKNWLLTYGCVLWVMRVRVLPRGPSGWQPQGGICAVIASAEFGVWRGAGCGFLIHADGMMMIGTDFGGRNFLLRSAFPGDLWVF